MTKIVGVDLSLTSTGIATWDGVFLTTARIRTRQKGHERLAILEDAITQMTADADLVMMESLSFNSFDRDKAMAGAWWIVRHRLWEEGIRTAAMAPATRAKWATGDGRASKEAVLAAANEHLPLRFENDDEADAAILAAAGARIMGHKIDSFPESRWAAALKSLGATSGESFVLEDGRVIF